MGFEPTTLRDLVGCSNHLSYWRLCSEQGPICGSRLEPHFLKQKKLIFNFFVNRNQKKLTDSRKRAKTLAANRKSHHPIETLLYHT